MTYCTEDSETLAREADATVRLIADSGTPLGPYENARTVLLFVDKAMNDVGVQMDCKQAMAFYASGRINGSIPEPLGLGLS